ncbi:Hsp20/alpha crystallin family protein [Puteibacter caeruleilacunae]|nr:Hsp20/alpha crystallin family protein [Puteibacter caeruleilacunae]
MRLVRFNQPERSLRRNFLFDDIFNEFDRALKNEVSYSGVQPKVNIHEVENTSIVELMVPGFNKSDLKIVVEDDILVISGKKAEEEKTEDVRYSVRQFGNWEFEKRFNLKEQFDENSVEAKYESGILTVSIKRKEEVAKPAPVEVAIS